MRRKKGIALLCALTVAVSPLSAAASVQGDVSFEQDGAEERSDREAIEIPDTDISFDRPGGLDGLTNVDDTTVSTELPEGFPQLDRLTNHGLDKEVSSNLETYYKDVPNGDHRPQFMVDGNLKTFTQINGDIVQGNNDWELVVNLEEQKDIDLVVFRKLNLEYGDNNNVTDYLIELSQDGETWSPLGGVVEEEVPTYDDMYFAPAVTRQAQYVRLTVPQASNWAVVAELEVYTREELEDEIDLSQFPNLALGGKASMDESEYGGHPASAAIDGNLESYAQANNGQYFNMTVKLKKQTTIDTAVLKWYGFGGLNQTQRIKEFAILTSLDGESWTEAGTHKIASSDSRKDAIVTFDPVEAAYVKFEMLDSEEWMAVNELEFYDTTKLPAVGTNIPNGSTVRRGAQVKLSTAFDADIYYTVDGSDPSASDTAVRYESPITVLDDIVIKACAKKDGFRDSDVVTLEYRMQYIEAEPESGIVAAGTKVSLINYMDDSKIFYTTDGSDPKVSETAKEYTDPIAIDEFTQIFAYSKKTDGVTVTPAYSFVYALENAAWGKTVTASTEKSGFEAENVIDGDVDTIWKPVNNASGEWIKFDFEAPYDFEGINILWEDENADYRYVVETSWDDAIWYSYYSNPAGNIADQKHNIQSSETHRQYMRVKILGTGEGANYGIREIEVLGGESAPVPEVPMYDNPKTDLYDRVVVNPMPDQVAGVENSQISLNGEWNFTMTPQNAFWRNQTDLSDWGKASIPGDLDAEGYPVYDMDNPDWKGNYGGAKFYPGNNVEMAYKQQVYVPEDYAGKKVFLRVDKAFNYARVWVNGQYVRDHRGAFNAWDADITDYIMTGEENWITVSVTAEGSDGLSFVELRSIRGILSDITMYSAPETYLNRLHVVTDLDEEYKDAELTVMTNAFLEEGKTADVKLTLKDMDGNDVKLGKDRILIDQNFTDTDVSMNIQNPAKWDAEHPNLYTLTAEVNVDGKTAETLVRKIGFREISTSDSVFKINGKATKLRGVNYHTVYGGDGIAYDLDAEKMLLETAKENNVNYIRAAHYPISDKTLNLCDELGIFVEQENSVCFAGSGYIKPWVESHEFYRTYMLHAVSEMVEKDRSHPSIVIWSIANESLWGSNHDKTSKYIKAVEPTIPTKFSWGDQVPADAAIDIHSNHYKFNGVGNHGRPTVWDEFAHSWSNGDEAAIRFDSGFRENYYSIIRQNWEEIYNNPINLGGAIWCYTDNAYEGGNRVTGNTNWGQVDIWGREKPEIWATKNVYSPVQYKGEEFLTVEDRKEALILPYENRYETVNFDDGDFEIFYCVNEGEFQPVTSDLAGKESGEITIPAPEKGWRPGDKVKLEFYKTTIGIRRNVVTTLVTIGQPVYTFDTSSGTAPVITDGEDSILVAGEDFSVNFSKETGLITEGQFKGETVITGGPFLNLGMNGLGAWTLNGITAEEKDGVAVVTIDGAYGDMGCVFTMNIDSTGRIETKYVMKNDSNINTYEAGIAYDLSSSAESISWVRDGYLNYYPEDQLGRLEGTAVKEPATEREWGVEPDWPWKDDDKDFYNFGYDDKGGRGTTDFNASKTGIHYAEMAYAGTDAVISVFGDGKGAVHAKINEDGTIRLNINNAWGFPTDGLSGIGNHPATIPANYTNTAVIKLADTTGNYKLSYTGEENADKDALQDLYDANKDRANENYTSESWNAFQNTLKHAEEILNDNTADQAMVDDAAAALQKAIEGLTVKANMTLLQELYDMCKDVEQGIYTDETWNLFVEARDGAKAVLEDDASTAQQVHDAWMALFNAKIDLEEGVNKELLIYAIDLGENTDTTGCTPDTVKRLTDALEVARTVRDDEAATEEQVRNAIKEIMESLANLSEAANKGRLQQLADTADKLTEEKYTPSTWGKMIKELDKAKAVLENVNATQQEVDEAYNALARSMMNLRNRANKKGLETSIGVAKNILDSANFYVKDTITGLDKLLKEAEKLYEDMEASQDQVNDMAKKLLEASSKARLKANKNVLSEALQQAKEIDVNLYTTASVTPFKVAFTEAETLMKNEKLSEDDQKLVDDAAVTLLKAINGLKTKDEGNGGKNNPSGGDKDGGKKTAGNPKTGDTTPIAGILVIMILGLGAGIILVVCRRKKNKQNN